MFVFRVLVAREHTHRPVTHTHTYTYARTGVHTTPLARARHNRPHWGAFIFGQKFYLIPHANRRTRQDIASNAMGLADVCACACAHARVRAVCRAHVATRHHR
eukprot:4816451-Prymnesium_polylepis.1